MSLILLPNILGKHSTQMLPASIKGYLNELDGLVCENARRAYLYLQRYNIDTKDFPVYVYDKKDYYEIIDKMQTGETWGLISDCGCPCIADPGSELVRSAHLNGIEVIPVPGPSSIFLSLMASGFSGQRFCFNGYLPKTPNERVKAIKRLEHESRVTTQIFMETPFRNTYIFQDLKKYLKNDTYLCISINITLKNESILTKTIEDWRAIKEIPKDPAIFLISRV